MKRRKIHYLKNNNSNIYQVISYSWTKSIFMCKCIFMYVQLCKPSIYFYTPAAVSVPVLVFNWTHFFPKKYTYPMCDNTWLEDTLLIMISLEAILSGQKGIYQTTYQILMGKGQCNICPVYFLLVSEFTHSIPLSQKLFRRITAVPMNWIFFLFCSADIVTNCFSAARAALFKVFFSFVKSE